MDDKEAAESICDIIQNEGADGKTVMMGALTMFAA